MDQTANSTYLQQLNEVQRQAVITTEGPVLVVAGPGSGKTRVLTYRIAHLIEKGVAPWEILSLTFTNKAAREMKERIAKVVGEAANNVWAGTFHSTFARILRVEAEKIGYPSNFSIYDTEDSKNVLSAIIKEMNLDKNTYNPNSIKSRISSAKSNLITPHMYSEDENLQQQDRMAKRPYLATIYQKYVARCKRSGAMDFDDLLFRLFELLQKNPDDVLDKYRRKFKYLLVDEFQDTNHLQYAIIRKLVQYEGGPRNVCVVGDDAQSIYSFRGATIQNMLDFEEDFKPFGIKVFKLEQNYRSTEQIVEAANEVITFNRRQIHKKIWSDKGSGPRIKIIKAMMDTEEGKRVADSIIEQKHRFHISNSDIAILYRTNAQSRVFEENLRRQNIPYRVFGGLSFYQRKEVKDLIAYLRLAVNQKDEEALKRAINYPRRGIGQASIDKLSELAGKTKQTMWDCMPVVQLSARAKNALDGFRIMIKTAAEKAGSGDAYELAVLMAKQSGLIDLLKSDTSIEGMGRQENINALLDGIRSFVEDDTFFNTNTPPDKSLASYLQNIALLTDFDENKTEKDCVSLMSVHSAKGLEFKSVFVAGLEEKLFPSYLSMDTPQGLDEERRLFYVAITRAGQFLTLSFSKSRYQHGKMRYNDPSRFLEELPKNYLDSSSFVSSRQAEAFGSGARVMGNFKRKSNAENPRLMVDPKTFKPSPPEDIQTGMKILHLRFGEGKVISIDGGKGDQVATIFFKDIENPQRRIVLKFSKLQIL